MEFVIIIFVIEFLGMMVVKLWFFNVVSFGVGKF